MNVHASFLPFLAAISPPTSTARVANAADRIAELARAAHERNEPISENVEIELRSLASALGFSVQKRADQ